MIYSKTRADVWPGAVGKACTLRNENLSSVCVRVVSALECAHPQLPMGVLKSTTL